MKKWTLAFITAFVFTTLAFADTKQLANSVANDLTVATKAAFDAQAAEEAEAVYLNKDLKLGPVKKHEADAKLKYEIQVSYPQITHKNMSENDKEFNKQIQEIVTQEIANFKKYVASDSAHMKTLPEELKQNSLRIDYDVGLVKPNNQSIISVRLSIEGMQAGRAHPYHQHRILNFNLTSGKALSLNELFKPRAKYLDVFAKYSKKKFNDNLEDKFMISEGTSPVEKNYATWNLEEDGILITFDEYQVRIPYSELSEVISPKAPISPCIQSSSNCMVV